jgi:phosphatidate cytidylyltransferase
MLSFRLISAAVGIPLLVLAVWFGSYWFLIPVIAIAVTGTWEFHRLVSPVTATPPLVFSVAIAFGLTVPSHWADEYLLIALGLGILISLAWQIAQEVQKKAAKAQFLGLAGPFYIGIPLSLAILLRDGADGRDWILLVLLATFSIDTGAYVVGRLIGKHKLAPRISPGKTWEGVLGGLLGGVGATFGLTLVLDDLPMDMWKALPLGLLLAIAGMAGDLVESWLKRTAGAKDSGSLVPGHGGVLDRTDSIVATLVVAYFWVLWAT